MARLKKIFKWLSILVLILLTIFVVALNVFAFAFEGKESAIMDYFSDLNTPAQIDYVQFENTRIRYVQTGNQSDSAEMLLFIHGAPGNLDNFKEYMADYDLRQRFKMVSMDRLGYGDSDFGNAENSLERQARAAAEVIRNFSYKKLVVVSHSYGGPVSGKLAADFPDLVDGIIMIAPLNDPKSEPLHLYSFLSDSFLGRLVLPKFIDVASTEKMNHSAALLDIKEDWKKISDPVLHIHGAKDGLAPFEENIYFSVENIDNRILYLERPAEMGHLLIWLNAGYIKEQILNFTDIINKR